MRGRIAQIGRTLHGALRPLRRTTIIGPLVDAWQLRAVLAQIDGDPRRARVLGPDEFAPYLRLLTPLSPDRDLPLDLAFDAIVIRQDQVNALPMTLIVTLNSAFSCRYANRRFALFLPGRRTSGSSAAAATTKRLRTLAEAAPAVAPRRTQIQAGCAILVTTFNRPMALARSLPQIVALGPRVVVVDDGTTGAAARQNAAVCERHQVVRLALPENRGLSAALNIGLAYLMADPSIRWISYFQDDVDVSADVMQDMSAIASSEERPLATGYDADEHPAEREEQVAGFIVKLKRSSPAVHLHGHVDYWKSVMPIPTEYEGAPRRRWEASLEDYWIVNNAPGALGRRGLLIACLPNRVRTFLFDAGDSTWDNPNQPDPPLTRTSP